MNVKVKVPAAKVGHYDAVGARVEVSWRDYQSGSRFEPGTEVQNRGSNRQLGCGRELDFRRNLNRNTGMLDEML